MFLCNIEWVVVEYAVYSHVLILYMISFGICTTCSLYDQQTSASPYKTFEVTARQSREQKLSLLQQRTSRIGTFPLLCLQR